MRIRIWRRIGWRNLGRNPRRTAITAAALAFGYFAVVLLVGLMGGLTAEMIDNGTGLLTGQLQIHDREYRPDRNIYDTMGGRDGLDVEALIASVESDPVVTAAAPRVYAAGLLSSGESTVAGMMMGIDPDRERRVSRFLLGFVEGSAPDAESRGIAIGVEMARQLDAGVGTEIIVVAPAADGSLGNDLYRVTGVFRTGMAELDAAYALLPLSLLQELVALAPTRVHELALATVDPWSAPDAASRLSAKIGAFGSDIVVEPWTTLRPEMLDYAQLVRSWNVIVIGIVFAIAVFGVANTMLMATYERRREFAMVMAVGATPGTVMLTVLAEALALGGISLVAGLIITLPVLVWWHTAPPDISWLYGDFTMFGALIRPVLRVEYDVQSTILAGVALVATALVASLYPAARAARVPPADILAAD